LSHGAEKSQDRNGKAHRFGGDWTTAKLDVLAKYLASYTTALKDKPSKTTPFRNVRRGRRGAESSAQLGEMPAVPAVLSVGNEKGAPIALRIANHLLTKGVQ
jgi:hypothetical protein